MKTLRDIFSGIFRRSSSAEAINATPLFLPAPIETEEATGRDALMMAARNQPADIIKSLMADGANIHSTDSLGKNAAVIALESGNWDAAIPLLEAGCLVNHNAEYMAWGLRVATYEGDDAFLNAVTLNQTLGLKLAAERDAAAAFAAQKNHAEQMAAIDEGMQQGCANPPRVKPVRFKTPAST